MVRTYIKQHTCPFINHSARARNMYSGQREITVTKTHFDMTPGSRYLRCILREMPCLDYGQLAAKIKSISLKFQARGIDLDNACGKTADNASRCWITWHLPALNQAMCVASMHVFEHAPGMFTLGPVANVSSNYHDIETTLLESATLVYVVLKHHRCVARLDLDESAVLFCYFPALLSKALRQSSGLEQLRVRIYDVGGVWRETHALAALSSALANLSARLNVLDFDNLVPTAESVVALTEAVSRGRLRRLALSNGATHKIVRKLFRAVAHSSCLSALEIGGSRIRPISNATALSNALKSNKTLRKLNIQRLENDAIGTVLKSLKDNATLEELELLYSFEEPNHVLWEGLEALTSNRWLKRLKLVQVNLSNSCALVIADILRKNDVLEEVCLSHNRITNLGAGALAKALQQNSTLKRLDIYERALSYEAVSGFVKSLTLNTTVEYVRLGGIDIPETWAPSPPLSADICARLDVAWNTRGLEEWASSLRQGRHHHARLCVGWTANAMPSSVAQWFDAARPNGTSITELVINGPGRFAQECGEAVMSFLEGTTSLKKITLGSSDRSDRYVNAIIRGLASNKSVGEAEFHQFLPVDYDVKPLQELMLANRTLHRLSFKAHYIQKHAVRFLARALEDNYVLVSFDLENTPRENMYPILSILDRNRSLLNRAVECALNLSTDGESVQALRLLSTTDSLLDALAEVSGKGHDECRNLVQESIRRLQYACASKNIV